MLKIQMLEQIVTNENVQDEKQDKKKTRGYK